MGEDLNQEGKSMISQGIPRFKIEHTEEQITPRSGLALFAEVIRALDVRRKVEGHFPKPGSNRGYEAWSYIEPVLLMLEGGGRHIEDLREIRDDAALRQLAGMGGDAVVVDVRGLAGEDGGGRGVWRRSGP
jgi:hypothetical protein